jgi:hypothetical protein
MPRLTSQQAVNADESISAMTAVQWAVLVGWCRKEGTKKERPDTLKKWLSTYRAARASSPGLSCLRGKVNKGTLREALRQAQLYSASLEII